MDSMIAIGLIDTEPTKEPAIIETGDMITNALVTAWARDIITRYAKSVKTTLKICSMRTYGKSSKLVVSKNKSKVIKDTEILKFNDRAKMIGPPRPRMRRIHTGCGYDLVIRCPLDLASSYTLIRIYEVGDDGLRRRMIPPIRAIYNHRIGKAKLK
jgi:hypothetical protein